MATILSRLQCVKQSSNDYCIGDVRLFQFPSGHPRCGWEGEFCQGDAGIDENTKASISITVAVFSMIAFLISMPFKDTGTHLYAIITFFH